MTQKWRGIHVAAERQHTDEAIEAKAEILILSKLLILQDSSKPAKVQCETTKLNELHF